MKKLVAVTLLALCCVALTPAERKIVLHAKSELEVIAKDRSQIKSDLTEAQKALIESMKTTAETAVRAVTAEAQAKTEHEQLEKAVGQNKKMQPVYDQCRKWFGLGAIIYGFTQIVKHLLILLAALVVIAISLSLLSFVFPWLKPVLAFLKMIWSVIISRFRK